jgi:hypothetical protein
LEAGGILQTSTLNGVSSGSSYVACTLFDFDFFLFFFFFFLVSSLLHENEWTDKIVENSEHQRKIGNGNGSATKFEHMKDFDNVNTADENKYGRIKICDNVADTNYI